MTYADLGPVHLWYDERGEGDPLVLMHGGLTDSRDFAGNLDSLSDHSRVLTPERRGHGHTADVDGPITIEIMVQDMIEFCEHVVGGAAVIVGYSAGAGVALWVAARRPDLVDRLVLISGAFDPDGMIVRPQAGVEWPPELAAAHAECHPMAPTTSRSSSRRSPPRSTRTPDSPRLSCCTSNPTCAYAW